MQSVVLDISYAGASQWQSKVSVFPLRKTRSFESSIKPELSVLFRVARRMAKDADDAEDLVSQTLMRAHQAWERFDGQHLRSWLIRILRNEFLKSLRNQTETTSIDDADFELAHSTSLFASVIEKISVDLIFEELDNLSPEFAIVIQLCDIEQMSYEDAAQALDIPIGTVRSRLFRARLALRNKLMHRIGTEDPS